MTASNDRNGIHFDDRHGCCGWDTEHHCVWMNGAVLVVPSGYLDLRAGKDKGDA